jgi:hypothetical protein
MVGSSFGALLLPCVGANEGPLGIKLGDIEGPVGLKVINTVG